MINEQTLSDKLNGLKSELASLEQTHNAYVESFKKQQEAFQQTVQANQNKWQQLTGAIAALEQMRGVPTTLEEVLKDEPAPKRRVKLNESRRTAV